jgi:hypothetical protein
MEPHDWAIVAATIFGPILAVQAQKWVEMSRLPRELKRSVFQTLMATRQARVSAEHVKALNMVELAFYGSRHFGISRRSKGEQRVLDAWHEYHNHLSTKADDASIPIWNVNRDDLFTNLLRGIADELGYTFDRVLLKTGSYSPMAHSELETDLASIRKLVVKILSGENGIKMDVTRFPTNEAATEEMIKLHRRLNAALADEGALNVKLRPKS